MKLSTLFLVVSFLNLYANDSYAQKTKISLHMENATIEEVLFKIESLSDFKFMFNDSDVDYKKKVTVTANQERISSILKTVFSNSNVAFEVFEKQIILKIDPLKNQGIVAPIKDLKLIQQRQITGTVNDINNQPLLGVNVLVEGTDTGSMTDFDGNFSVNVGSEQAVLVFTYVGMKTVRRVVGQNTIVNVQMIQDDQSLDEVIITGYGQEARRNVTASIASIKPTEITSIPTSDVTEMLEGRLPGVQILSDNSPGGGTSIRVRGYGTINNNDPLVVVDGVPVSNGLNGINPSDIETIQVLKDAASSSIYGSRAANGVVVITTKNGSKNGLYKVNLDIYSGVQSSFNLPKMLNAQQYGNLLWQASKNDGQTPSSDVYGNDPNNPTIPEWLNDEQTIPTGDVSWINEIMQVAEVQSYNLSLSKGDEKAQHSFSLGYFNQEGIIKHTGFKRYSARFNSNYNIGDFVTIGQNFTASYKERVSVGTNSALGSIVYNALQFPSIVPVKDINGDYAGNPLNDIANPLGSLNRSKDNKQRSIQALGNIYAEVKSQDFTARTSLGLDYQTNNYRGFSPVYDEILTKNDVNSLSTTNSFNYQLTWTNTLHYSKKLNLNNIDVLIGQEAIKYYNEGFGASRQSFLYEDLSFRYLSYGTQNQLNFGDASEWTLNSYFGQAKYNYDQKYLFTATVRRDGTSRLANNNWGTFPSFSAGWRLDREDFFDFGDTFSSFLLRGSWGQTGNQQLPSYSTVDSYSNNNAFSNYGINGGQNSVSTGLTQTRVPNQNLEWETSTQSTLGIDLGFYDNKLQLTAEYFNKLTENILVYNIIPLTYGGTNDGQWINDGKMENKGFELDLSYADTSNDFGYNIALNLTTYKNKLTELNSVPYLGIPSSTLHNVNFDQEVSRSAVGQSIGSFYGYTANGLFQTMQEVNDYGLQPNAQPGDIRFEDSNDDGVLDNKDRTFIGSPHPDALLGLNLNFTYKNFDLGLFFNGSFGNDLYNLTKYKTHFFNQAAYNKDAALLNAWTPENSGSLIARLSLDDPNNNIRPSSYYVENGSYFKLNNAQLGYTLNSEILSGMKLRIYGQATNLFTITEYSGMNPQIGLQNYSSSNRNLDIGVDRGIYPPSRTFTLGINATF